MVRPIRLFGDPALRAQTRKVPANSEALGELLEDLTATVRAANGIGLAAPQIGRRERVFVVDLSALCEDIDEEHQAQWLSEPLAFVNPTILWESEDESDFEEGCLSIPDVREVVVRPERVRVAYRDAEFNKHTNEFDGLMARVIQHEYDHLEGVLFIDYLSSFRRALLKRRLREVARGEVEAEYPVTAYRSTSAAS